MDRAPLQMTAPTLLRHGFGYLLKPPFRTVWMVMLLVALAAPTLTNPEDDFSLVALLVLSLITFLLEMTAVLAATTEAPDPSADHWIRTALRHRGLWRFVLASVLTDILVGLGLLVFIVGGFIAAGMFGLAPQVALLEKRLPMQALRRSAELTKPARSVIATIYGLLVLLPTIAAVVPYTMGYDPSETYERVRGVLSTTMTLAAWIALTRAFVELRGEIPNEDEAAPDKEKEPA